MNSNNASVGPFKKRQNPLESSVAPAEVAPAPAQPVSQPIHTASQPSQTITRRTVTSQPMMRRPAMVEEPDRIKYTATMSRDLHRRLKVAAAMNGLQISALIEDAILEKLDKEGL